MCAEPLAPATAKMLSVSWDDSDTLVYPDGKLAPPEK